MYYVGSRSFSGKDKKEYNLITLADVGEDGKGGSATEFFVDKMPEQCKELLFGDLAECELSLETLSSKPRLVGMGKLIKKTSLFLK
jgi:hypothetical protein